MSTATTKKDKDKTIVPDGELPMTWDRIHYEVETQLTRKKQHKKNVVRDANSHIPSGIILLDLGGSMMLRTHGEKGITAKMLAHMLIHNKDLHDELIHEIIETRAILGKRFCKCGGNIEHNEKSEE